jgi:DNA repair protein RadA/Sms
MPKPKSNFVCTECGASEPKWNGKCSGCGAWNTMQEQRIERVTAGAAAVNRHSAWTGTSSEVRDLKDVKAQNVPRVSTGLYEFDRVLGGGLVRGSVNLIGGEPGIGKSTLLLQTAASYGQKHTVVYVTGEESADQIALRAERLDLGDAPVRLVSEIDVTAIIGVLEAEKAQLAIIDSIQTVYHPELLSAPGSVAQVRECAAHLTRFAKTSGCTLILIGHVTKEGTLAGPRVLEHIVDAALFFEGENGTPYRMLRALKNRFGAVNEMGVFAMGEKGLEEVSNPSSLFMTQHDQPVAGCSILAAMEGNRPMLVEVQALVEDSPSPNPRRYCAGMDVNRLQMVLAVLHKHTKLDAFDKNVYLKIVGGVRLTEPAADLAVLLALYSSFHELPLPSGLVAFGEVGLAGELRAVQDGTQRLKEAAKLGFTRAIVPAAGNPPRSLENLQIIPVRRVEDALNALKQSRKAA